ncbi:formate/nitrite transporter [Entomoplasma ellychniae]|uniref:Formate/nitrite transporter n=1 Tax=Entomoplasma ellychniae TaxID=2114 RepID=A0A8E2UAX7_9MOLU|nr:formate/nitrite transporter family protein [Entomoplasma ellychniae]PPE04981.1 formate/nitrite transporter [Entomoplasma ellychniae]
MILKFFRKKDNSVKIQKYDEEIKRLEQEDFSSLYNQDISYHNYGYVHTFRTISDGLRLQNVKQFSAGILAGFWISLAYVGAILASYSLGGDAWASLGKIVFSAVFAIVIVLISFLGGGFVTAHMWYNRTMFKGVERWTVFMKACGLVYLGNIIGMFIVVIIFQLSGTMTGEGNLIWEYFLHNFIEKKLYNVGHVMIAGFGLSALTSKIILQAVLWTFMSAILCNFLVCLATQGSKSTKGNAVASMIMYLFILFYFAIGGYQHCVANWFIAWMIITNAILAYQQIDNNLVWIFLLINILPSILGNWVGALIIGYFMGIFNKEFDALLVKEAKLRFLREEVLRLKSK